MQTALTFGGVDYMAFDPYELSTLVSSGFADSYEYAPDYV